MADANFTYNAFTGYGVESKWNGSGTIYFAGTDPGTLNASGSYGYFGATVSYDPATHAVTEATGGFLLPQNWGLGIQTAEYAGAGYLGNNTYGISLDGSITINTNGLFGALNGAPNQYKGLPTNIYGGDINYKIPVFTVTYDPNGTAPFSPQVDPNTGLLPDGTFPSIGDLPAGGYNVSSALKLPTWLGGTLPAVDTGSGTTAGLGAAGASLSTSDFTNPSGSPTPSVYQGGLGNGDTGADGNNGITNTGNPGEGITGTNINPGCYGDSSFIDTEPYLL